jgi:hypothetical protein
MLGTAACWVLVGLLWGATNPLIKRGSVTVEAKRAGREGGVLGEWRALLTTPSFLLPQLLNQAGSVLFAVSLAYSDISVAVPIANATSLAANAVADLLLGERFRIACLLPGLLLVGSGIVLCTLSRQ